MVQYAAVPWASHGADTLTCPLVGTKSSLQIFTALATIVHDALYSPRILRVLLKTLGNTFMIRVAVVPFE